MCYCLWISGWFFLMGSREFSKSIFHVRTKSHRVTPDLSRFMSVTLPESNCCRRPATARAPRGFKARSNREARMTQILSLVLTFHETDTGSCGTEHARTRVHTHNLTLPLPCVFTSAACCCWWWWVAEATGYNRGNNNNKNNDNNCSNLWSAAAAAAGCGGFWQKVSCRFTRNHMALVSWQPDGNELCPSAMTAAFDGRLATGHCVRYMCRGW